MKEGARIGGSKLNQSWRTEVCGGGENGGPESTHEPQWLFRTWGCSGLGVQRIDVEGSIKQEGLEE